MIITLQPSEHTDQVTEDGTELTQLPYPYHVNEDGTVGRQDFWRGEPVAVIGFTARPEDRELALRWAQVVAEPELAVGKYVVVAHADGSWHTLLYAIEAVGVTEGRSA